MLAAVAAASLATVAAVVQLGAANPQAKLADDVRRATATYQDAALAEKAGYGAFLGCVSGPQEGAMGVHYVNGEYVNDDVLDPQKPEALMYELKDGKLRLLGVEYIIFAEKWHAKNPKSAPTLGGQVMHYTGVPTATASRPSTPSTYGRGAPIRAASSRTGTPRCRATTSQGLPPRSPEVRRYLATASRILIKAEP